MMENREVVLLVEDKKDSRIISSHASDARRFPPIRIQCVPSAVAITTDAVTRYATRRVARDPW
ncbi:MAG: hypothetical protein M3125_03055, partial [Gemmatimonadota bacterium]|nr:hypothetical protein [Gemmatimonadota bacterium]